MMTACTDEHTSSVWDRLSTSIRGDKNSKSKHKNEEPLRLTSNRRFARFKRDEAVVMRYMNDALEREQKQLERKRQQKEKQKLQAKHMASARNKRRQKSIEQYILQQDSHSNRSDVTAEESSSSSTSTSEGELQADVDCDSIHQEELGVEVEFVPKKTIQWCDSVDQEMERRRIHRLTHPGKPGGIATRIYKQTTCTTQDNDNIDDLEALFAEYRRSAGLPVPLPVAEDPETEVET